MEKKPSLQKITPCLCSSPVCCVWTYDQRHCDCISLFACVPTNSIVCVHNMTGITPVQPFIPHCLCSNSLYFQFVKARRPPVPPTTYCVWVLVQYTMIIYQSNSSQTFNNSLLVFYPSILCDHRNSSLTINHSFLYYSIVCVHMTRIIPG